MPDPASPGSASSGSEHRRLPVLSRPPAWTRPLPWLAILAIVAATIGVLRGEGRRWWCACGNSNLWSRDAQNAHSSQHLFDPYSFTHVLHGMLLCAILAWAWPRLTESFTLCAAVFLEALWEILENSPFVIDRYRTATIALGYEGDSIVNSLGDILSCAVGYMLARHLGFRWSVVYLVATEVVLLWWIRDNLFLNILMLITPIDAIKTWQAAP